MLNKSMNQGLNIYCRFESMLIAEDQDFNGYDKVKLMGKL